MKTYLVVFVRDDTSGRIPHHEIFEADDLSPADIADRLFARKSDLRARYADERYDVRSEGYNTFDAMARKNPDLQLEASKLVIWS